MKLAETKVLPLGCREKIDEGSNVKVEARDDNRRVKSYGRVGQYF